MGTERSFNAYKAEYWYISKGLPLRGAAARHRSRSGELEGNKWVCAHIVFACLLALMFNFTRYFLFLPQSVHPLKSCFHRLNSIRFQLRVGQPAGHVAPEAPNPALLAAVEGGQPGRARLEWPAAITTSSTLLLRCRSRCSSCSSLGGRWQVRPRDGGAERAAPALGRVHHSKGFHAPR